MMDKPKKNARWPLVTAALLLGAMFALGRKITFCGDVHASYTENTFADFAWTDALVFAAASAGFLLVLWALARLSGRAERLVLRTDSGTPSVRIFWIFLAVLCVCWLPFFLLDYPGTVLNDSFSSIAQVMGDEEWSNNFPVVYTLFVGVFIRVGLLLGSMNTGIFLYSLTQALLIAAAYAGFLTWLYRRGVRLWFVLAALAFFALVQMFPMYAVIMWKDPLFTVFLLLLTMQLADAALSRGELLRSPAFCAKWAAALLCMIFFRNNGIYIAAGLLVLLPLVYRWQARRVCAATLGVIVLSCVVTGPVYDAFGIEKGAAAESLGVPLQQMAYVLVYDGEMTDAEREVVTSLLPEEEYRRVYTPCIVDSVKRDYGYFDNVYLTENTAQVLRCWATIGVKNFPAYVKAYCLQTFGFWKIGVKKGYGGSGVGSNAYGYEAYSVNLLEKLPGGGQITEVLQALRIPISPGTLFALWLAALALTLCRRQHRLALATAPAGLLWGTIMLATPTALSMRYVFLLLAALPLVPVLPCLAARACHSA